MHLCTRRGDQRKRFVSLTSQGPGWSMKVFAGGQGSLVLPQDWPSTQKEYVEALGRAHAVAAPTVSSA